MINLFILCAAAYLAGSVNFSILLFKILGKDDPRSKFSGNAGTTNVYRQAGKFWAALILVLDVGKAIAVAVIGFYTIKSTYIPVTGFFLILGTKFPCFHGFKGGKGVANYLGFTLVTAPLWAGIAAGVWVIVYLLKRIPFIASFFMTAALAAGTIIVNKFDPAATTGAAATAILIIFNHRNNIINYKKIVRQNNKKTSISIFMSASIESSACRIFPSAGPVSCRQS